MKLSDFNETDRKTFTAKLIDAIVKDEACFLMAVRIISFAEESGVFSNIKYNKTENNDRLNKVPGGNDSEGFRNPACRSDETSY